MQLGGTLRNKVSHVIFDGFLKQCIAGHAARKWPYRAVQIESCENLRHLPTAFCVTNPVAVCHHTALQQPAVAREQDAMFRRGNPRQPPVTSARLIPCIETEHSQVCSKPAQMDIEYEP